MAPGRICWQFARSGVCNREQCRFLHQKPADTHKPQESQNGRPRNKEGGLKSGKNCREWQRDVEARCTAYISPESLEIFFGGARQLIERDAGTMQDVVRFLADEPGLRYIQQLVEKDFDCMPHHTKKSVFAAQMVPFLEVISHPKVLSSLVAEHHMGAIFNFIYGIGGTRAIKLFGSVCAVLKAVAEEENIPVKWLELSLLVFTKTLDVNSTAFVQEGLKTHALGLQEVLRSMNTESSANKLHVASRYLEQLLHRFEMGAQMSAVTELNETEKRNQILTLMAPQDPPGGRHDNDHADISAIQILPTLDEILSPRGEYLPECNPSRWHVGGREGLLDRNFRLLREDSVGPLRSIICQVLKEPERDITRRNQQRTYLYHGAKVVRFSLQFASGILFLVEFPQLQHLRGMEKSDREAWWKLSKRLQKGSLVCLTVNDTTVIFCTVSDIPLRRVAHNQKSNHKSQNLEDELAVLWMNPEEAFITLTPVNPDENTIRLLLDMLNAKGGSLSMIEFPGVLMAGFEATLRALQRMKQASYLPFENLLTFSSMTWDGPVKVPPPLYSLHNGFQFNLRCLMKDGSDFYVGPFGPVDLTRLKQNSILDEAQAVAVVDSLQRCVGLIQGPPGTGKSYTGIALVDVLLHNKRQGSANIGPVLCVAYTNHALDQLLEAFMDKGITSNIIRIGSQSKSDQIEACKLRIAAQRATKTKLEQAQEHNLYLEIGECEKKIETLRLHQIPHVRLPSHLRQRYPEHFQRLFGKDPTSSEALELKNPTRQIRDWLESGSNLPDSVSRPVEELIQTDIIATSTAERERLHGFWIQELRQANNDDAIRSFTAYTKTKHELEALRNELDLRCLSDADVIGVTTSGLARNLDMFSKLQAKFVLCEEAGEVLEAHLLTALLPSVEHVILIGDHQQLRPHIQNYNLSRENHDGGDRYSLDVSLFERLVEPRIALGSELPFATLETQRRMHPSIARLVRDTIYPDLKDADNVSEYPEVCGMKKRLFWVDHRVPEADNSGTDGDIRTASHWNNYEVEMTIALVSHLVNQGKYKSGEIAVLTPYLGQLHRLRQRMSNLFTICIGERDQDQLDIEGFGMVDSIKPAKRTTLLQTVRVATIDNFQGEEAKVVIISLVRSNSQNRCGFLKTSNRINVLLSRAQHGLYIIGNSETAVHVPMWEQVVRILQEGNNIGSHLELQCPRHPETPINQTATSARLHARQSWHVATFASDDATNAGRSQVLIMGAAGRDAADPTPAALTFVKQNAMGTTLAHLAKRSATLAAAIQSVQKNVPNHAHHVRKRYVVQAVHIAYVPCRVQPLATISHALGVVRKSLSATTNAHLFVEKHVHP
ncbi:hypothetical protein ARAM_006130 [Aspergillus rambellii]|uniref:C3H1-type domain-containing protein n=1 Tax=Aspergillus rambellii TaxID=308745 RepID=A0A0F8XSL5_9EURO|nr:hypothetical protein ARAM_006130 [Aspergillus rambellii]